MILHESEVVYVDELVPVLNNAVGGAFSWSDQCLQTEYFELHNYDEK